MKSMKKKSRKKRKQILSWLILADLVMLLGLSCSLAYFTSVDEVTNSFKGKNMNIALSEFNYGTLAPKQRITLIPNRLLPKDPMIQNIDETDVFVFIKLTVPVYTSHAVADDGTIVSNSEQEVFILKSGDDSQSAVEGFHTRQNDDDKDYWVELPSFEEGTDYQSTYRTYVFGYSVYLKPYEYTETLFDYIELKNIKQFDIAPGDILDVKVDAFGIQADYLENIIKESGNEKAVMSIENLSTIYGYVTESGDS